MRYLITIMLLVTACGGSVRETRPEYNPNYQDIPPGTVGWSYEDNRERPRVEQHQPNRLWAPDLRPARKGLISPRR